MACPKVVLHLTCLFLCKIAQMTVLSSSFHQESGFISAHVGDSVTLRCFYDTSLASLSYWYKEPLGQKPRLISRFYIYSKNVTFFDECKDNSRFSLDTEKGKNHLIITALQFSDSATYYCASSDAETFEFGEGATVTVKGSGLNIPALVHQSVSETIQPGGSVTLNCTVHIGTYDGEHSVYWFKDSGESHPGIIYTHGDRNNQSERKPETRTQSCVYNLPTKKVTLSNNGTYYCAVALCGHMLFRNGSRLDFEDEMDSRVSVYFLSGALAFTTTLCVLLMLLLCTINKRNSSQCTESNAGFSTPPTTNTEVHQNEENIHYAALKKHDVYRSRGQRKTSETECVYSRIKQ